MEKRAVELIQAEERVARLERELSEIREIVDAERFEQELLVREKAAAERRIEELEEKAEVLRLEVERLTAAKAAAEQRLMEREGAPEGVAQPGGVSTPSNEPVSSRQVPRRPPPKGAFFHVDWDMSVIEYESHKDILEIYQSMNMSQLSLEGYHGQHCSAWILAMKKRKSRQVYVVFGLVESGLNLVYRPAKSIRDDSDYKNALNEAVKFLEVVGYLPEKMSLGKSLGEHDSILDSIPILQGPQKSVKGT